MDDSLMGHGWTTVEWEISDTQTKTQLTSRRKVLASAAHRVVVNGAVQDHHVAPCALSVRRTLGQLGI